MDFELRMTKCIKEWRVALSLAKGVIRNSILIQSDDRTEKWHGAMEDGDG